MRPPGPQGNEYALLGVCFSHSQRKLLIGNSLKTAFRRCPAGKLQFLGRAVACTCRRSGPPPHSWKPPTPTDQSPCPLCEVFPKARSAEDKCSRMSSVQVSVGLHEDILRERRPPSREGPKCDHAAFTLNQGAFAGHLCATTFFVGVRHQNITKETKVQSQNCGEKSIRPPNSCALFWCRAL